MNEWGRQLRNKYRIEIEECRVELEFLRNSSNDSNHGRYEEVSRRMSILLAQEEAFWKQRAKVYWLRDGDTNSRFFHATASAKKKRNEITHLKNDEGDTVDSQHEICEVAKAYFDQLFSPGQQSNNDVIDYIAPSITEFNNDQLMAPFQIREFKEALFAMHSDKAPGPDGLNPTFYKRFWNLCGVEIFNAGVSWLERGSFPEQIMATNIVLIPKKDNPETMKDLRPISLCNVLYKIISKVLANRLKPLLPQCISQEQSAFVENRSIIDNVMIASEIIHHMKCKTKGKMGEVALKIDISKAYDRVDWGYVKKVMQKMGFHEKWVNWISMCMESVHYQVLVNGESVGPVKPMRGLRQGDPLSPYIFIMCAEGLSRLIKKSEARGEVHGIKVCRGAPLLTHLLFADDCFLFCRADVNECTKLKMILKTYEEASGQAINLQKSEIFFSKNTSEEVKENIKRIFQVSEGLGSGKYLGLPSTIGRKKKAIFGYLRDRVWKRIQQWSGKHLSKAGREVLIKSVAQSIPTYCMSTFLLPTTLGEEIQRMINSFWWGANGRQRKGINWLNWDKLCMRKEYGGMNFRHLYGFNLAMLGKQGWKLLTNQDTIVTKIFKAKYFPKSDFLGASLGHNPSFVWRSIYTSQVIVRGGLRWCIGDGRSIELWKEPWLRSNECSYITTPMLQGGEHMKVADIMETGSSRWNWSMINTMFNDRDIREIHNMAINSGGREDKRIWKFNNKGHYTVKSAYRYTMENLIDNEAYRVPGNWMLIWNLRIPQRVKIFLWRVVRGCLPTRDRLQRKGIQCTDLCPHCETTFENEWHLFIGCDSAKKVWMEAGLWDMIQEHVDNATGFENLCFSILAAAQEPIKSDIVMVLWCVWKRRNEKIWEEVEKPASLSIQSARELLFQWREVRKDGTAARTASTTTIVRWQPSEEGTVKCNVDAALFNEHQQFGAGICIRGAQGIFIKAKTIHFEGSPPPMEAEAYALKEAIIWLGELGLSRVDIELDCLPVVQAINDKSSNQTEFGIIIEDCKILLANYPNFKISFIRRQANFVAHTLARASRSYASHQTFDLIPSCIVPTLMNEIV
jgi:hypothetical protein